MKQLIQFLIIFSSISFVFLIDVNTITKAPIVFVETTGQGVSLEYDGTLGEGDVVSFAIGEYDETEPLKFTAIEDQTSPIEGSVILPLSGTYSIYIRAKDAAANTAQKQTKQLVVTEKIDGTIISKAEGTFSVTLTVKPKTIYNGDKIIFSTEDSSGNPSDALITIKDINFEGDTHSQLIAFTKNGLYNIFIKRGETNEVKQNFQFDVQKKTADIITSASLLIKKEEAQEVTLTFTKGILATDVVSFSTTSSVDTAESLKIDVTGVNSPLKGNVAFKASGIYNIFVRASGEDPELQAVKQTIQQYVAEKTLDKTVITKISGTAKVDTQATITLTVSPKTLYIKDKIIYSITTDEKPSTDKQEVELTTINFDSLTLTQTVTFPKEGEYKVFIKRGDSDFIQTNQIVSVKPKDDDLNGSLIKFSFVILLSLILL